MWWKSATELVNYPDNERGAGYVLREHQEISAVRN